MDTGVNPLFDQLFLWNINEAIFYISVFEYSVG